MARFAVIKGVDGWYFVEHIPPRHPLTGPYPTRTEALIRAAWELGARGLPIDQLAR